MGTLCGQCEHALTYHEAARGYMCQQCYTIMCRTCRRIVHDKPDDEPCDDPRHLHLRIRPQSSSHSPDSPTSTARVVRGLKGLDRDRDSGLLLGASQRTSSVGTLPSEGTSPVAGSTTASDVRGPSPLTLDTMGTPRMYV